MKWLKTMSKQELIDSYKNVQKMTAEDTIKHIIEHLLQNIGGGHHYISPEDLAEQSQITDEDVIDFACRRYSSEIEGIDEDIFCSQVVDILNSSWYEQLYQEHVDRARQGFRDEADWEATKKSLMPTFKR